MKAHPISELFPLLGDDDLQTLAHDIKANGLRQPVVTYEGMILDGRNRWRACKLAGLREVDTLDYEGDDPAGYVVSANLHRRHLTTSQRAMVAAALATGKHGGARRPGQGADLPLETLAGAAEALGVSERSVKAAREVRENGTAEEVAAVTAGDTAVSRAEAEIRRNERDIREAATADPGRFQVFADRLNNGDKPADVHRAFAKERNRQTTKGEALKDATGAEVPSHLRDLFGDPWLLQTAEELEAMFRDAINSIRRRVVKKGPRYAFLLCGEILKALNCAFTDLESAHSLLTEGRPHAVCPKCGGSGQFNGEGCKACRSSGWLPRWRLTELKSSGEL